jgi:hypothetical protein
MNRSASRIRDLLAVVALALGGLVHAQTGVGIQPPASRVDASPSETVNGVLTIDNPSSRDLDVSLSVADWFFGATGGIEYLPSGSTSESAAPWLTYEPATMLVPAEGSVDVRYTLDVPGDARPGSHWVVVFAEASAVGSSDAESVATMRVRTGHAMYVDVQGGDATLDGTVGGVFPIAPASPESPVSFDVQYVNTGDYVQFVDGRVDVLDLDGTLVAQVPVASFAVLPGYDRTVQAQLYGPLDAGTFVALVVLTDRVPGRELTADTVFTLDEPLEAPSGREEEP